MHELFVCLSVCLYVLLIYFIIIYMCVCVCMYVSICLSVCLYIYQYIIVTYPQCDGKRIRLPRKVQGIVVLNIGSYMAGTNFWGTDREKDVS